MPGEKSLGKVGVDKLIIELQNGDFEKEIKLITYKYFQEKRGIIQYKTLANSILTVESVGDISL